jgi:uncharacterized repeat protein (TIGR03803 family)
MPAHVRGGGLTALASFDAANGKNTFSALTFDANGNLYGAAQGGGVGNNGTVWELAKGSSSITALASFNGTNGHAPSYGVTFDANGNLYGTTGGGGANGSGTVWELAKGSSSITTLASFDGSKGANPSSAVTFDANGNLYGTSQGGGANNLGMVWELTKGSGTITTLASFNGTNGRVPTSGVTFDANGNLYGTTELIGANGVGTVWELAKGSSTITALDSFGGTKGANPDGAVTFDANGNLYGTAFGGGAKGFGTVWEMAKGSSTITALASFDGTNGASPISPVTFDANGNLYGTAVFGGANGIGTVWEMAKGSSTITALASFDGTKGANPELGAIFDTDGNLYGATFSGGANSVGTVWEFSSSSVPEPSSLVLGLVGSAVACGAALLKHHRRSLLDRVFTRFVR